MDNDPIKQDIDIFRVGNFVEFPGYKFLEIIAIDESNVHKTFTVSLNGQQRVGIPDGMMKGIELEEKHLAFLGIKPDDFDVISLSSNKMMVHQLQNHFSDLGRKLNFAPLRQFQIMDKR